MALPIIFMYSGQGSQYYQMGRALFEQNPVFRHHFEEADRKSGLSIIEHIYDDSRKRTDPFLNLQLSHPAIFIIEYALTQVLLEKKIQPDYAIGASVGEFSASVLAGILDFDTALQCIVQQADAFIKFAPAGRMIAILEDSKIYQTKSYFKQYSELAALDFPAHFVVAGLEDDMKKLIEHCRQDNLTSQVLPVGYGFHSRFVDSAKSEFLAAIKSIKIKKANMPVISCINGKEIHEVTYTHFWDIVREPILFQNTIQNSEAKQPAMYIDLGPSGTLATFVKYNLAANSSSKIFPILTMFGNEIENYKLMALT